MNNLQKYLRICEANDPKTILGNLPGAAETPEFKKLLDSFSNAIDQATINFTRAWISAIQAASSPNAADAISPSGVANSQGPKVPSNLPWFQNGVRGFLRKLWYGNSPQNPDHIPQRESLETYNLINNATDKLADAIITDTINEADLSSNQLIQLTTNFRNELRNLVHQFMREALKLGKQTASAPEVQPNSKPSKPSAPKTTSDTKSSKPKTSKSKSSSQKATKKTSSPKQEAPPESTPVPEPVAEPSGPVATSIAPGLPAADPSSNPFVRPKKRERKIIQATKYDESSCKAYEMMICRKILETASPKAKLEFYKHALKNDLDAQQLLLKLPKSGKVEYLKSLLN